MRPRYHAWLLTAAFVVLSGQSQHGGVLTGAAVACASEDDLLPAAARQYLRSRFDLALGEPQVRGKAQVGPDSLVLLMSEREDDLSGRLELVTLTLLRQPRTGDDDMEEVELGGYVRGRMRRLSEGGGPGHAVPPVRVTPTLELILLSVLCEVRDLQGLARDARAQARRLHQAAQTRRLSSVSGEFERLLFWNACIEFGNAGLPWSVLATDLESYLTLYPTGHDAHRARQLLDGVRLVEADASLSSLERSDVELLVHMLPLQNGKQLTSPGEPSAFLDRCSCSPARMLLSTGVRAVPALANALMDTRPTRTVGFAHHLVPSHYVLRVRDVAAQVIERMSMEHGLQIGVTWRNLMTDVDARQAHEAARAWLDR